MRKLTRFQWEREVRAKEGGPSGATMRHVLLTIATHANKDLLAWPTMRTLMKETRLYEHAVSDHVNLAIEEGWIERVKVKGEGKGWKNAVYRLSLPNGVAVSATASPAHAVAPIATRQAAHGVADGVAVNGDGVAPEADMVLRVAQSNNVMIITKNIKENITCSEREPETAEHDNGAQREASGPQPYLTALAEKLGIPLKLEGEGVAAQLMRISRAEHAAKQAEAQRKEAEASRQTDTPSQPAADDFMNGIEAEPQPAARTNA